MYETLDDTAKVAHIELIEQLQSLKEDVDASKLALMEQLIELMTATDMEIKKLRYVQEVRAHYFIDNLQYHKSISFFRNILLGT